MATNRPKVKIWRQNHLFMRIFVDESSIGVAVDDDDECEMEDVETIQQYRSISVPQQTRGDEQSKPKINVRIQNLY